MDRSEYGIVGPGVGPFDGNAFFLQRLDKEIQVFLGLVNDPLWKRALRDFFQRPAGKLRQAANASTSKARTPDVRITITMVSHQLSGSNHGMVDQSKSRTSLPVRRTTRVTQ